MKLNTLKLFKIALLLVSAWMFISCDNAFYKNELFTHVPITHELPSGMTGIYASESNDTLQINRSGKDVRLILSSKYDMEDYDLAFNLRYSQPHQIKKLEHHYLAGIKNREGNGYWEYFLFCHHPDQSLINVFHFNIDDLDAATIAKIPSISKLDGDELEQDYLLNFDDDLFLQAFEKGYFKKSIIFKAID